MIIPEEVICKTCEKVFCCSECREKHEVKTHTIVIHGVEPALHLFCPICLNKPLILHIMMHQELLIHITNNHLPLNCKKCSRLYTKLEDFMEFSKCIQNVACKLEIPGDSALQIIKKEPTLPSQKSSSSSVSTQTSPIRISEGSDSHLTPISIMNLRWKAKSKLTEELTSDSVSSLKNISSINNSSLRRSIEIGIPATNGKLVRSTSTPLQAEIIAKPKEQAFNASGGHVSSIYNSASETENSPPMVLPPGTPSKRPLETVSRYQKPRGRSKMYVAVTPLRQVMSKSIQKAIAEHGIATGTRGVVFNRKKMFDSIETSGDISEKCTETSPLDLRLSPALRRTQSEIINHQIHLEFPSVLPKATSETIDREILLSSTKKTTKSIVITSTSRTAESVSENIEKGNKSGNSVYETCRSVEIITSTSTELSEMNINKNEVLVEKISQSLSAIPSITPRIPNSGVLVNKKLIKFETPLLTQKSKIEKRLSDEQYFTPSSTPIKTSKVCKDSQCKNSFADSIPRKFYSMTELDHEKGESFQSNYTDVVLDDEVFVENKKPEQSGSKLWSLVASVIRLPSLGAESDNPKLKDDPTVSTSLIKRCASFAGSLIRQKSIADNKCQALKRKRTYTADSNTFNFSESKRFRIQGRKPIQRMQCYD